jgi:hypothetical protein
MLADYVKAKFDIRYTESTSADEILSMVYKFLSVTNGEIKNKLV